jgi:hypothetical protein
VRFFPFSVFSPRWSDWTLTGHDPYAYLKDVLTRLPTHKASRIVELLPHRWKPADA